MEEIIKFLDKVLEALRTESKFKGDFKGHKVIVTNYNDQFAFYVDNHVVRDIPRVELVEMYLKQALSEIVLGKKVMDFNPITQWLIDNKVSFVERVMDSKGARTLILFPHTINETWLNLRRVKDDKVCKLWYKLSNGQEGEKECKDHEEGEKIAEDLKAVDWSITTETKDSWNCEGQSTKFQRLEDSSTATYVLNVVKSYVYSVKDSTDMNLNKIKDTEEFDKDTLKWAKNHLKGIRADINDFGKRFLTKEERSTIVGILNAAMERVTQEIKSK